MTLYVGTYTDGTSKGIYRTALDLATGTATAPVLAGVAKNPSFLALHPSGRFLYAVSEVDEIGPEKGGGVLAFAVDAKTGDLTLLNQQPSKGGAPCHLVVDKTGKNVLVANYSGGNVALLRVGADGRLEPASVVRAHEGSGPNAQRQKKPHAHGIYLDAAERTLRAAWPILLEVPQACCTLLLALDEFLQPRTHVVLRANDDEATRWTGALARLDDDRTDRYAIPPSEPDLPGVLAAQTHRPGGVAYVCRGLQCLEPVTDPAALGPATPSTAA